MTPYPAVRPSYPLSEVKAGVSCDPPPRCDRNDRYQIPFVSKRRLLPRFCEAIWVSIVVRFFEKWFRFGDSGFVLIRDSLKLGGVWIVDQWPKAKTVDGSWTPPPVDEIIALSAAILAEAIKSMAQERNSRLHSCEEAYRRMNERASIGNSKLRLVYWRSFDRLVLTVAAISLGQGY
jgi:hypothetical protein